MVKNIVNAIVEQMEKENLLNIEMKECRFSKGIFDVSVGEWVVIKV